jgi:hypothetical protein
VIHNQDISRHVWVDCPFGEKLNNSIGKVGNGTFFLEEIFFRKKKKRLQKDASET